jgi:hypothetical protein
VYLELFVRIVQGLRSSFKVSSFGSFARGVTARSKSKFIAEQSQLSQQQFSKGIRISIKLLAQPPQLQQLT